MKLEKLNDCINNALVKCQEEINNRNVMVLSEADFERLVANKITEILENIPDNDYSVHTQLSHFADEKPHVLTRPDIVLLNEQKFVSSVVYNRKRGSGNNSKNGPIEYKGPSIAIELKFLRVGVGASIVKRDLDKWDNQLTPNKRLYIAVLIDTHLKSANELYERKRNAIDDLFAEYTFKDWTAHMVLQNLPLKE